ncbi:hypothetical protein [Actinomadura roseirufa]|uniref:hypothetical protein n=1 Tax=Actinomadura roseirufa TaxID=2094049 RepID=UPI0010413B81|nr:hypothetical protein [Actinomadura roseirufa]
MGYPGDQGSSGGWPPAQPPQAPHGPGAGRPDAAPPYGDDGGDAAPFSPRADDRGGPSGTDPFGFEPPGSEPYPPGAFGAAPSPPGAFGAAPPESGPFSAMPPPAEPFGAAAPPESEPFGAMAPPAEPFGAAGTTAAWADGPPGAMGEPPSPGGFGSPGPADPPGPGDGGPPPRRRNLPLIIGGSVVAGLVLIGGGVGVASMMKDDPKPKAAQSPSPRATKPKAPVTPSVPPLEPVKLKSRTTDPAKLTLSEVFRKSTFKAGKQKYLRTAWNDKKGCVGIVGGTTLTSALKKGDCKQALRATYALGSGQLIGTVGVLNLKTEAAAKAAVKAAGAKDAFLRALPGSGISKTNGKGEALGTCETFGHYVVMTWVQRPDGKKIASQYHSTVRAFGSQLVDGSGLSLALHYRETEGKPLQK